MSNVLCRAVLLCGLAIGLAAGPVRPAAATPEKPAAAGPAAPKLLVLLAVDQMRTDYVDWYGSAWKGGLHRLFSEGTFFRQARYPYLETVTCAGHATLGTGAYPHASGMMQNVWYDRAQKKLVECTADPTAPLVGVGPVLARPGMGDSAKNLALPTLGDEMQAQLQPPAKVVGLSMKARSAITMAGHKPDLVLWFENGTWVTSTAFAPTIAPWVTAFITSHPIAPLVAAPWTRLLPATTYKNSDDGVGERPGGDWTPLFPHALKGDRPESPGRFTMSPVADDYLAQLALAAVDALKLGQGAATDFLGISFSMADLVGHHFGPRSHEVQDVLLRLDGTLERFLGALDQKVGKDRYVVALSADHGVAEIPEQLQAQGKDAGRILEADVARSLNTAIARELVAGAKKDDPANNESTSPVVGQVGNEIYLAPGVYDRLRGTKGAVARVLAALRKFPGIADAVEADAVAGKEARQTTGPGSLRRAAALSYFPERSGDLLILPKPNWIVGQSLATTHGSTHDYDRRVPVVFYGRGVKALRSDRPVSPADVAPTLAALLGVTMKQAEGSALPEIAPPGRTPRPPAVH